jgi:SnoaL-like protein
VDNAIARYRAASETNDIDALMATLAPDAELISPISGRMVFRGQNDLRALLHAVYSALRDWKWREELGDETRRVVIGDGRVGPFKLGDAMVFELAPDGRIRRIRPHLRPWLGLTGFALVAGPRIARHPGVIWRALQAGG